MQAALSPAVRYLAVPAVGCLDVRLFGCSGFQAAGCSAVRSSPARSAVVRGGNSPLLSRSAAPEVMLANASHATPVASQAAPEALRTASTTRRKAPYRAPAGAPTKGRQMPLPGKPRQVRVRAPMKRK